MMRLAAVYAACVAACIVATWSPPAHALALGEIELQSGLNEPLAARIPVRLSAGDDFQNLRVTVAAPEDFGRSGLQFADYLLSVALKLTPARGSQPAYVVVSSPDIAREPFLDLMIEAKSARNRIFRNYTLLLDPPVLAAASPSPAPAPQPAATAVPSNAPSASYTVAPKPAAPAAAATADAGVPSVSSDDPSYFQSGAGWVEGDGDAVVANGSDSATAKLVVADNQAGGQQYGPIGRKETLWSIAYALRPDTSITMDQMQLAIFRANPQAFDGNINRLLTGAMLDIPSAASIRATDAATAKAEVARQRSSYTPPKPAAAPQPTFDDPSLDEIGESDFDGDAGAYDTPDAVETVEDFDDLGEFDGDSLADSVAFDDEPLADEPDLASEGGDFNATEFDDQTGEQAPAVGTASTENSQTKEAAPARPLTALERLRAERNGTAPLAVVEPATDSAPVAQPSTSASDEQDAEVSEEADSVEADEGFDEPETADDEPVATPSAPTASAPIAASSSDDGGGGLPWALIGGLGALVLAVLAFFGIRRRRAAADNAAVAAPVAEDTTDTSDDVTNNDFELEDTAVLDEAEFGLGEGAKPKPREDVEPDVAVIDDPVGLTETAVLDAAETEPADPAPKPEPEPEADEASQEDAMAATMQFDANTISLDLSGDDPVSEADVHLAYGATDEAAAVLEAAVKDAPDNAAYRNKLAEVYFTGNAKDKFVAHARASESVLKAGSGDAWQKLLILGQQIAPEESLFSDAETAELQSADFDFGSDPDPLEGASQGDADDGSLDLDIESPVEPAGVDEPIQTAAEPASNDDDGGLEFDLGGLDLSTDTELGDETKTPEAAATDDGALEFDLGELDLGESSAADASPVETESDDSEALEFDLDSLDLGDGDSSDAATPDPSPEPTPAPAAESADESPDEFDLGVALGDSGAEDGGLDDVLGDLGDFDLGDDSIAEPPAEDSNGNGVHEASLDALLGDDDAAALDQDDDDIGTKLDLARAYVDMGDEELAESLLKDVAEGGDDAQKAEANELMSKLSGG